MKKSVNRQAWLCEGSYWSFHSIIPLSLQGQSGAGYSRALRLSLCRTVVSCGQGLQDHNGSVSSPWISCHTSQVRDSGLSAPPSVTSEIALFAPSFSVSDNLFPTGSFLQLFQEQLQPPRESLPRWRRRREREWPVIRGECWEAGCHGTEKARAALSCCPWFPGFIHNHC